MLEKTGLHVCVYIHICMYVYIIYTYTCTHTHTLSVLIHMFVYAFNDQMTYRLICLCLSIPIHRKKDSYNAVRSTGTADKQSP